MITLIMQTKKVYSGQKMSNEIILTKENIIQLEAGEVKHAVKNSSNGFISFGEAYFSKIKHGHVKGWKKHKEMTLNLVVPYGKVIFIILNIDKQKEYNFYKYELSAENNCRLTIPPSTWFAFKGLGSPFSLVLNIASIIHDPNEVESLDIKKIVFDWESLQ